jgi:hypothetical protein
LTPGCSTTTPPTITIGAPTKSDRSALSVSSPVPTKVRCVWRQGSARCEHQNTTPFRLVFPGREVYEISLSKPVEATGVVVEIRPPDAAPNRFVMDRGSSGMKLASGNRRWQGRIF